MSDNKFHLLAALTAPLLLSGCMEGIDLTPQLLPTADGPMPTRYTATGGGIGDILTGSGRTWDVMFDGTAKASVESMIVSESMVYDATADQWIVNINQINYTLENLGGGTYGTAGGGLYPKTFSLYDADGDGLKSQYGTFGTLTYDTAGNDGVAYAIFGLQTATPPSTGSGRYVGVFEGTYAFGGTPMDSLVGTVTVTADFGPTGGVTFTSSGNGGGGTGASTYDLAGTATLSGGGYAGTLTSGSYSSGGTTTLFSIDGASSLLGQFYGPDPLAAGGETAGVVQGSDTTGTYAIVGGFWATFTP